MNYSMKYRTYISHKRYVEAFIRTDSFGVTHFHMHVDGRDQLFLWFLYPFHDFSSKQNCFILAETLNRTSIVIENPDDIEATMLYLCEAEYMEDTAEAAAKVVSVLCGIYKASRNRLPTV